MLKFYYTKQKVGISMYNSAVSKAPVGSYCDININSKIESYVANLIFHVVTCNNVEGSRVQGIFSHQNASHYPLTILFLQMINS